MAKIVYFNCPNCGKKLPITVTKCIHCNSPVKYDFQYTPTPQEIYSFQLTTENYYDIMTKCWRDHYCNNLSYYDFTPDDLKEFHNFINNKIQSVYYNPIPTKPMSPTSSAIVGTAIGGTAVGMAAGLSSISKEQKYQQDLERYHQGIHKQAEGIVNAKTTHNHLLNIIKKNENAIAVYEEETLKFITEKIKEEKFHEYIQRNGQQIRQQIKANNNSLSNIIYFIIYIFLIIMIFIILYHVM